MKFGVRKPSLKKSVKARTTGKMKRKMKSAMNPMYGKKGMGYVRNPKKAMYNKVYNKTTVGVNPLSATSKKKRTTVASSRPVRPASEEVIFTKYETIEKNVPVTNPFEKFWRRLTDKPTDTKIVQEKVVVEQYTQSEMEAIQAVGQRHIEIYNDSIKLVKATVKPDVFFSRLNLAEQSLEEVVHMIDQYSFLRVDGDNLKEALATFKKDKDTLVKEFVDRHYSSCVDSAEKLKTERGKQNRYIRNYHELSEYFSELPESAIGYINQAWAESVPFEELKE